MTVFRATALFVLALFVATPILAQDSQDDTQGLSQAAANPIADLISIPFQNNTEFGLGPHDRNLNVLNIQPVVPFAGGKLVTRTIFPVVWIPDINAPTGRVSGLSDIVFTGFYVPQGGELTWGVGPVVELPSGGGDRGSEKWSLGISGVALAQPGQWTLGVLANNVWSVAGKSDREDVNKGLIQYFIVYQLGEGWYVNSAPILTVDWKAADGQKWKVPFGGGGGKVLYFGKLPVNIQSQVYYYVSKPDVGPDWELRVQVQLLLPTGIFGG